MRDESEKEVVHRLEAFSDVVIGFSPPPGGRPLKRVFLKCSYRPPHTFGMATEFRKPRGDESSEHGTIDAHPLSTPALERLTAVLRIGERLVFCVVALLLFGAALVLAYRALQVLVLLVVSPAPASIGLTAHFLDLILLILMIAEIAYTVTISLRGAVLTPQPFLVVGLIAVIRRILVMTVQEVQGQSPAGFTQTTLDLGVLTVVVIAFVFAMYLMRRRGYET